MTDPEAPADAAQSDATATDASADYTDQADTPTDPRSAAERLSDAIAGVDGNTDPAVVELVDAVHGYVDANNTGDGLANVDQAADGEPVDHGGKDTADDGTAVALG